MLADVCTQGSEEVAEISIASNLPEAACHFQLGGRERHSECLENGPYRGRSQARVWKPESPGPVPTGSVPRNGLPTTRLA